MDELLALNHFDLDIEAFSSFSLDIKLQNTLGIPGAGTSGNLVLDATAGHTRNLALGPSVQVQATYDNAAQFAIPQNASILTPSPLTPEQAQTGLVVPLTPEERDFKCFSRSVTYDLNGLAAGRYPNLELFERVRVDAGLPLAAWLQEASRAMGVSRNIMLDAHADAEHPPPVPAEDQYIAQAVDLGQLAYTFTVQYTGGLDAKFSLVSSRFNPLNADLSAGVQQTGTLNLYLNGYQTITAINAKGGLIGIYPSPKQPQEVIVVGEKPAPGPKIAQAPAKVVTPQGQKDVKALVENEHKDNNKTVSQPALDNLLKQIQKNQALPGQMTITRQAIQQLNLPRESTAKVEQTIQDNTVTQVPPRPVSAPASVVRPRPRSFDATRQNNGRGYIRAPIGFSVQ
ncbi:hypothetical protein [Bradyrhizobium guangxiense]|uniref:hypothetical protein n=1 Tax=Bradyrhizobium guangxiense TaxID=1325115 RepID=UPI001008827D|nr:hypothetical protein [Bradyrhizobium guangxiense]